ncbi:MAG: 50S ribosomal protein L18, partial [Planctomycetes bacterium]|nr:50S ribosomal protein L18 [Planctomycetota bacterium]
AARPRLTVFRSARHIYAQLVDDQAGRTLASSSTMTKDLRSQFQHGGNVAAAKIVGQDIATKAMAAGVDSVIFDRNGFRYHGRLQALAEAAREKGLKF